MSAEKDALMARKGRVVSLVIAGGGLLALFAPVLVRLFGLEPRYEILFYLFSLAAFVWAIVNIYQIWRIRQDNRG